MQVKAALALARSRGVERLDAQLLLSHALGQSRSWLIAHDDHPLAPSLQQHFVHSVERRAAGEPLAYLIGEREFHGLRFVVSPAVLVPRPETELLVDWSLAVLRASEAVPIVDLGTGSGAIAVTLARRRPDLHITATDIDLAALQVAQLNAQQLGASIECLHGSWWQPVAGRRFQLAVSNPPYIDANDHHLPKLRHEPRHALTPGGDGLAALRQIVCGAPAHLQPGSWLLLEHGHDQGAAVRALLDDAGFTCLQTRRDLAGLERCSGACWPGDT